MPPTHSVDLTTEHRDLMAKDQNLNVLRPLAAYASTINCSS
jgi:hypothetical protein